MAQDFALPQLHPFLKLYQAGQTDGEPSWSLHNPASNAYYKISWAEFECLARFSRARTAQGLKSLVESETTLRIDIKEIAHLVAFLHEKGLLSFRGEKVAFREQSTPLWKKILHGYLYFTIPLFRPQAFLEATLPFVRPLMSRTFITVMMTLLIIAAVMTFQRLDEFAHSFSRLFTLEGLITGMIVLGLVKVVHEFSHAYTAVKYGVTVPHMGVAMIVMYPVLYTETTGSWKLASRRERFHIGIAGITSELCLAALFLLLWNIMPAGSAAQGIAFAVVAISLIGSLLINLNPLMRFDGYYMLSDLTGIENLQTRACDFARWQLRKWLFALPDETPEFLGAEKEKFLIVFGFSLLIYRFFLFMGIALLVYHIFFKPLGLFLMLVEIGWFILLPIWSELVIWWNRRADIVKSRRGKMIGAACAGLLVAGVLPLHTTVYIPAVMHGDSAALYPHAASRIEEIFVEEGQEVEEGAPLIRLSSSELVRDIREAEQTVQSLKLIQRGMQANPDREKDKYASIEVELETKQKMLEALRRQQDNLLVKAPFPGKIRDMDPSFQIGLYVQKSDMLLRVIDNRKLKLTGYILEDDIERISGADRASFIPDAMPFTSIPATFRSRSVAAADHLGWPELASVYGGPVSTELDQKRGYPVPLRSVYEVTLDMSARPDDAIASIVQPGEIRIKGEPQSSFGMFFKRLAGLILRESGLN